MFITKLELIGFKSFADRTKLEFRPGVMAVVGPNGCGKSNIVDAVRWVLGEQRTSTLRAERMEGVIFNGTQQRKPLGMSEATITIENDKGLLPSPYSEIAITRRLFRSGESEYRINRNPSRLRDINDLFVDTGFGTNTYSIIELSMVEGIITGPSESRRILIEEAAGVAKYKSRRQSALRKLSITRENLSRIEDIYQEVERSYRYLKRQATRARRYQVLNEAVKLRLLADLAEERLDILQKRKPLEEKLAELEDERKTAEKAGTRATSDLLSLEGRELALIDRINRTQDNLKRLDRREAELQGELALSHQRIDYLMNEKSGADKRRKELNRQIDAAGKGEDAAQLEVAAISNQLEEVKSSQEEIASGEEELQEQLREALNELETAREVERNAADQISEVLSGSRQIEDEYQRLRSAVADTLVLQTKLADRIKSLKLRSEELTEKTLTIKQSLPVKRKKLADISDDINTTKNNYDEASAKLSTVKSTVDSTRTELLTMQKRASASELPKIMREYAATEGAKSLAERLVISPEYQSAVSAALSDILNGIDVSDLEDAVKLGDDFSEHESGVMRLARSNYALSKIKDLPASYEGVVPLNSLVDAEGDLGGFIESRLSRTYLVPDSKAMRSLEEWAIKNEAKLVDKEGRFLDPDGIFRFGASDPAALRIGWAAKEERLERDLKEAEASLSEAENRVADLSTELASHEQARNDLRTEILGDEQSERSLDHELKDVNSEDVRLSNRLDEVGEDISKLNQRLENLPKKEDDPKLRDKLETVHNEAKEALLKAEETCDSFKLKIAESKSREADLSTEFARLSERISSSRHRVERFNAEAAASTKLLAELESNLAAGKTEMNTVRQALKILEQQMKKNRKETKENSETLGRIRDERNEVKLQRDDKNKIITDAQARQNRCLKERSKIESETIAYRERLREIDRRLEEEADFRPANVSESVIQDSIARLDELKLADLAMDALRSRLNSVGPVNMMALDDIDEVEQRYSSLTDQKKDILEAMEVLQETIDRINSEARRRFKETFDLINNNFQIIFRNLFDGGEAQISLSEGDPLESDIRIWATPSGKKLQGLSMLSGGEKALTAIALLFAIYQVRPSPFCVLDEVDAPLDDTNVVKFNGLIRTFSQDTQFMIVTHNKRTMEAADSLYGVTLGPDGSSRLVSVEMNTIELEKDSAKEIDSAKA